MDPRQLIIDGTSFATQAVQYDQAGNGKLAQFFYIEASEAILKAISIDPSLEDAKFKALQYVARAEALADLLDKRNGVNRSVSQSEDQKEGEQIEFMLAQALAEDENGHPELALPLYTDAIALCLEKVKTVQSQDVREKLNRWARGALERAEAIKRPTQKPLPDVGSPVVSAPVQQQLPTMLGNLRLGAKPIDKGPKLTQKEIDVLKFTSYINGRLYPPWLDVDLGERFAYKIPFSDPDGLLELSPKQKVKFGGWVRPSDICENPQMIYAVSSFSIRQTIVSDCSFVASLAISAAYERQFKKQLITGIIYPQDRNGQPMINPCGKYMVKLRVNGVARKIIVDDTLPMGKDGELLCSFSHNRNEFWVSLLEKAYMKIMGGYDFPGSNSNIDLNSLTGWIPERSSLKSKEVNTDVLFDRLVTALKQGDALATVATGELSDIEADRAGLVPTHAYAVLDIKKVQGLRLCQLKNPWSHLRWKGKFSEGDAESWTPELQRILGFDRLKAVERDNGVFWINWESLLRFYDVVYMNWNPKLFSHRFTYHALWRAQEGPVKDAYNIGDNPQYGLEVNASGPGAVLWILLTRHITQRDDFANNKEFITVHVYQSDGRRLYYPEKPLLEGTKINSPHYLAKIKPPAGRSKYTLVVSQYEKLHTIYYTIKVYSTAGFQMAPVPEPYTSKKKITLQWTKETAGGSVNNATYSNNPKVPLELIADGPSQVLIKIEASRKYAAGVELVSFDRSFKRTSGDYRWGFVAFEVKDVPAGEYYIIPSTFLPGQEGPFFLEVQASCAFRLKGS